MKNSDFIIEMEKRFNNLEGFSFQQFSLYNHLKQMQAEGKDIDKNYDGEELFVTSSKNIGKTSLTALLQSEKGEEIIWLINWKQKSRCLSASTLYAVTNNIVTPTVWNVANVVQFGYTMVQTL